MQLCASTRSEQRRIVDPDTSRLLGGRNFIPKVTGCKVLRSCCKSFDREGCLRELNNSKRAYDRVWEFGVMEYRGEVTDLGYLGFGRLVHNCIVLSYSVGNERFQPFTINVNTPLYASVIA